MNDRLTWRKSSLSNAESACVELALTTQSARIRDTKNRAGGTISIAGAAFGSFLRSVRTSPR